MRLKTTACGAIVGFTVMLAACDSSNTNGNNTPSDPAVSSAQVSEMSAAATEGADESLGSLLESVSSGFALDMNGASCPTITMVATTTPPSIVTTVQFGGLPESVTFPPADTDPCLFGGEHGHGKLYLFGRLVASASGTHESEFQRSEELDNVGFVATDSNFATFWRGQRDGTRSFSRDVAGVLTAAEDLTTTRSRKTDTDAYGNTVTSQLSWSFTPAAGTSMEEAHPRPSGEIQVTGSWSFKGKVNVWHGMGDARTHELVDVDVTASVKTNQPLEYDATCSGPPRRRIKSGQLEFARTNGDAASSFTLTWTACGVEPTQAAVPAT